MILHYFLYYLVGLVIIFVLFYIFADFKVDLTIGEFKMNEKLFFTLLALCNVYQWR